MNSWVDQAPFQILSISGGGARGIYSVQVLAEIEKRFKKPIYSSVDLFCGTSIGGIIALALAAHIPAAQVLEVFDQNRKEIFPPAGGTVVSKTLMKMKGLGQLFKSQYSAEVLRGTVQSLFGDLKIGDLKSCVLIPAINYTVGRTRAFKTPHSSLFYQDAERTLVDVALATSAAPTYFPLHTINGDRFVDGGLVANNPILMGIIEGHRAFKVPLANVQGLCIGNMGQGLAVNHERSLNLGYAGWGFGRDIIDLSMSASEKMVFDMGKMLLEGRLSSIDSDATQEQAHLLKLDNGSDAAAEILKGHALNEAGSRVNDSDIQKFFSHSATAKPQVFEYSEESILQLTN